MSPTTGFVSLARRMFLAGTLAIGAGTLWGLLFGWFSTSALESLRGPSRNYGERVRLTTDGTLLIQTDSVTDQGKLISTYREPGGPIRDVPPGLWDRVVPYYLNGGLGEGLFLRRLSEWPSRIRRFVDETAPNVAWYFVYDGRPSGFGEFIAYDRMSRREIGHLGLGGFREGSLPADERFPVNGEQTLQSPWSSAYVSLNDPNSRPTQPASWDIPPHLVYVPSGRRLLVADLAARTVTGVFEAPEPILSMGIPPLLSSSQDERKHATNPCLLVRAGSAVYRIAPEGKVIGKCSLPPEIRDEDSVFWYELDNGRAIFERRNWWEALAAATEETRRVTIYRVAPDGTISDSSTLTLRNGPIHPWYVRAKADLLAASIPAPAVLLPIQATVAAEGDSRRMTSAALWASRSMNWPALFAVMTVALVLAAGVWTWHSRSGASSREGAAWAVFMLLFGVPGFVGFMLHRRWPARVTCPNCGSRAACDRDACSRCERVFPAPALNGTEIFA